MNCEEIRGEFPQYLEGNLTGDDLRTFEEHLREGEACRLELEHAREIDALLKQRAPEYWGEIEPDPSFVSRLETSGPWAAPKRAFSLRKWLFAPWQSRRIVTVALSAALVVAVALLVPRAFMVQQGPIPAPVPAYEESDVPAPAAEGVKADGEVTPAPRVAPTPMPTPAPAAVPTPASPPAGAIFTYSGMGSANTPSFEIDSSPWKLRWSAAAESRDRLVIKVIDAQTGLYLSKVTSSLEPQGKVDSEIYLYDKDKTGEFYLSIRAAPGTKWEIEVLKSP